MTAAISCGFALLMSLTRHLPSGEVTLKSSGSFILPLVLVSEVAALQMIAEAGVVAETEEVIARLCVGNGFAMRRPDIYCVFMHGIALCEGSFGVHKGTLWPLGVVKQLDRISKLVSKIYTILHSKPVIII
jgi:hypothetical protein